MNWVDMVKEFHRKHGQPIAERPALIKWDRADLRAALIQEEANETIDAIDFSAGDTQGLAGIADGLADTIYVCIGAALEYGIDLDAVMAEVHRSNMTKTPGNQRADGKIAKGPEFEPPRLVELIRAAQKR